MLLNPVNEKLNRYLIIIDLWFNKLKYLHFPIDIKKIYYKFLFYY